MVVCDAMTSKTGEPTWEITKLFPNQGDWSETEYLALETNQLIEFSAGRLEFLPMPTQLHQFIVFHLYRLLWAFVTEGQLGVVLGAPMRVRVQAGKYREPDILFMARKNHALRGEHYWRGADLVVEVVSPDDPERDYVLKRQEYAEAGIAEYWIVDPMREVITVLALEDGAYVVHGEFASGEAAVSKLLAGFTVDVAAVFAAAG